MTRRSLAALLLAFGTASSAHAMELASPDVQPGSVLATAQLYPACGGSNISPALSWSGAPGGTKSFAVTLYDPDARGGWWHWIVYDIPASVDRLASGGDAPPGARLGRNDFGGIGYGGACPPPGSGTHHYRFTLWALPTATIPFADDSTGATIGPYLEDHALARATLTAIYER